MFWKYAKYFGTVLLLGVFALASSGFIIGKYFCSGCNSEHQELIFIDIKDSSQKNHDCKICLSDNGICSCSSTQGLGSTEYNYFYLDNLYFSSPKTEFKNLNADSFSFLNVFKISIESLKIKSIHDFLNLPPPFRHKFYKSASIQIMYSVFIL